MLKVCYASQCPSPVRTVYVKLLLRPQMNNRIINPLLPNVPQMVRLAKIFILI